VSQHSWKLVALDKTTGKMLWERVAHEGIPKTKRHPKSSQASATPVTDGRHVIVSFGSEGLYAYDVDGKLLWTARPRRAERRMVLRSRLRVGHRQLADHLEEPGHRPVRHPEELVHRGVRRRDTASRLADTRARRFRRGRRRRSSKRRPHRAGDAGDAFIRGYDPRHGKELWRLSATRRLRFRRRSSDRTDHRHRTATARAADFRHQAGRDGDITLKATDDERVHRVEHESRRALHPTPVIYGDLLYVLGINGVLAAYDVENRAARLSGARRGGGRSARHRWPLTGKLYLTSEDGDVFVVKAGSKYELLATNSMSQ
jgi:hypothetical protein